MDVSTPHGRFSLAYASWQHARFNAGFGVAAGNPPQALALASHSVHWALELDRTWEEFEGEPYVKVRRTHPAGGVLAAMRAARDLVGVVAALRTDEAGAVWRLDEALPALGSGAEVYSEHLAGRDFGETETAVLDLFLNGNELAGGAGRIAIAEGAEPMWDLGDQTPYEPDPQVEEFAAQVREDLKLMREEPPEVVEAIMAARGERFLTVVHHEDFRVGEGEPSAALAAWQSAIGLVSSHSLVENAVGYTHNILRFGPPYAEESVEMLARIARALNPGGWEITEGYRPPEEEEDR